MKRYLLVFGLIIYCLPYAWSEPPSAVVIVPVADVWSRTIGPGETPSDDLRETQVLAGEQVLVKETQGPWLRVEAVEQPEYSHHKIWEGYPGWIDAQAVKISTTITPVAAVVTSNWASATEPETLPDVWLPLGSMIRPMGETDAWFIVATALGYRCLVITEASRHIQTSGFDTRRRIMETARKMLGVNYLWGGLTAGISPPQRLTEKVTKFGLDCSGLVHVSYRVGGFPVPRDALEQWMKAKPISRKELLPADLIFSAKADNPKKVTHVALYAGDGQIIEAPQTGTVVRKVSFKEKYGKEFTTVESGDQVGDRVIYFGSFLHK